MAVNVLARQAAIKATKRQLQAQGLKQAGLITATVAGRYRHRKIFRFDSTLTTPRLS